MWISGKIIFLEMLTLLIPFFWVKLSLQIHILVVMWTFPGLPSIEKLHWTESASVEIPFLQVLFLLGGPHLVLPDSQVWQPL